MAAPTTPITGGTATLANTTGEANGLLLQLPAQPPPTGQGNVTFPRVRFGFFGTFTSCVVAIRGRLAGLVTATYTPQFYGVRAVLPNGSVLVTDSTNIALTDSTNQAVEFDATGFDQVEIWLVSGTGPITLEVTLFASGGAPTTNVMQTSVSGAQAISGATTITVSSANALAVGPNGTTNPTLVVVTNVGSEATGLKVTGAAAAGGLALAVISSGTDESLSVNAKGAGTITLNGTATGGITMGQSVTMADAKNIILNATTGTKIGTATTQKLAFFNQTPVVQPAASTDVTGFVAGSGTASKSDSVWAGASGASAYTVGGIVTGLKALGLLAA